MKTRQVASFVVLVAALVVLPLVGVGLAGHDLRAYVEFPPLTRYVEHAPFSWVAFVVVGLVAVGLVSGLAAAAVVGRRRAGSVPSPAARPWPWWGWAGLVLTAVSWWLAWSRCAWFAPCQRLTFTPLWLGYILVVSAWCVRRGGACLLRERPLGFALLFPVSAGFWWFFEYLNRFVQNWYYRGVEGLGPGAYIGLASLSFSTVLPAVLGTRDLLLTVPGLNAGLQGLPPVGPRSGPAGASAGGVAMRAAAGLALATAATGLALVGVLPDFVFPLLWVAPLLIVLAGQVLAGQVTVLAPVRQGDWRNLVVPALAALVCGFFWEMWNIWSFAKWEYAVPFVGRFHLFEMPAVGYAGYLPFGLECVVIGEAVLAWTPPGQGVAAAVPSESGVVDAA